MLFRVLDGKHAEGGRIYKKGDVLESKYDLTKIFQNKFERVYKEVPFEETKEAPIEEAPVQQMKEPEKEEEEEKEDERGKNVTKDFPAAVEYDLTVFEKLEGKKVSYFVYDHAELKSPKKGLKSAEAVREYLNDITEDM